jgi:hypothetical protein
MSLSLKTRKLQTFEICVMASRPQTSEAYLSATRGQIRLQFWIFTFLIDPNKHKKFHENLRWSLPTLPKSGWFDTEWPVHCTYVYDHIKFSVHLYLSKIFFAKYCEPTLALVYFWDTVINDLAILFFLIPD